MSIVQKYADINMGMPVTEEPKHSLRRGPDGKLLSEQPQRPNDAPVVLQAKPATAG